MPLSAEGQNAKTLRKAVKISATKPKAVAKTGARQEYHTWNISGETKRKLIIGPELEATSESIQKRKVVHTMKKTTVNYLAQRYAWPCEDVHGCVGLHALADRDDPVEYPNPICSDEPGGLASDWTGFRRSTRQGLRACCSQTMSHERCWGSATKSHVVETCELVGGGFFLSATIPASSKIERGSFRNL